MREIKFKAWDRYNKRMAPDCFYGGDSKGVNEVIAAFQQDLDLMQYTGLKDKNGKEIYEGDVVAGSFAPRQVLYRSEVIFYNGSFVLKKYMEPLASYSVDCEIIGNIYENPGLLK